MVRPRARPARDDARRDPARCRVPVLARGGLGGGGRRAPAARHPPRGLRRGHHLRHEQRVRLRLPARQHGAERSAARAARAPLRDRRRGRLGAHRRGADAADHLRPAGRGPLDLPALQRAGAAAHARRALHRRGAHARRAPHRGRHRGPRARARRRQHVLGRELPPHPLHGGGAEGHDHLRARPRLRRARQQGRDRRRVHRPPHGGTPLVRRAAPGRGGQGARPDPARVRHLRDDHAPELLPALRQARRHDRDGCHRRRGVPRDLHARRRRDPDAPSDGPRRPPGPRLPHATREVRRRDRRGHETHNADGRPVLVGTVSIEDSEHLSELLKRARVSKHEVLNAKQHQREAAIVARAGQRGAVTIATNMAGRGYGHQARGRRRRPRRAAHRRHRAPRVAAASTTSCEVAPAARATPARRGSTSPSRTTSCGASPRTGCPG